ncbi:hypothetical protein HJG60_011160 [Phyllostomus discolor]|uniref:Uncharacterized protein n=1 Tax=Phyllostomus discolor TaxID=89673 RepID=A0A834A463_9CHIR|nr:hypothetical protein HJG60_011160 [Phyllostomus discolor]
MEQAPLLPLGPCPNIQHHSPATEVPHPGEHLRLCPSYTTGTTRPKGGGKMAQTELKAPQSVLLSKREIVNLSDAQLKALVIRMLTELVESGHKLDEQMKATISEMKKNAQGTNSDGKKTGFQINGVDQKEDRNNQTEKNEETRIQKNEERLRNLQDIFKRSNI